VRRALAVLGVLIAAGLGWGYWHARTRSALHVALRDVALKSDRVSGDLRAAEVAFTDEAGTVLATGSAGPPHGVFSIRHPTVGDCRREERAATADPGGMAAWNQCFATQSRWLPTWVRRVRYAEVKAVVGAAPPRRRLAVHILHAQRVDRQPHVPPRESTARPLDVRHVAGRRAAPC